MSAVPPPIVPVGSNLFVPVRPYSEIRAAFQDQEIARELAQADVHQRRIERLLSECRAIHEQRAERTAQSRE